MESSFHGQSRHISLLPSISCSVPVLPLCWYSTSCSWLSTFKFRIGHCTPCLWIVSLSLPQIFLPFFWAFVSQSQNNGWRQLEGFEIDSSVDQSILKSVCLPRKLHPNWSMQCMVTHRSSGKLFGFFSQHCCSSLWKLNTIFIKDTIESIILTFCPAGDTHASWIAGWRQAEQSCWCL